LRETQVAKNSVGVRKEPLTGLFVFLREQELAVTHSAPNRYLFQVEGSAPDIERVLHIRLNGLGSPNGLNTIKAVVGYSGA